MHCAAYQVPSFIEHYKTFTLCTDLGQLSSWVETMAKEVDLFHAHNEPSWFVSLIKEITDKPVVLDVHDSFLARSTPEEDDAKKEAGELHIRVSTEERNNFQLADALVYPGDAFRKIVETEFALTQPALTLPSYVPQHLYRYNAGPWMGGLVYEGKVTTPENSSHGFQYANYLDLAKEFNRLGVDFHLYAGKTEKKFHDLYGEIAFVHPPLSYNELLKAVSCHDWGLVGNLNPSPEWKVAMPNKLFEYLACGVPVVAMNADDCAELILREGIGIVVKDPDELAWRWAEHRECRANVIKKRRKFAMDAHIHKLEELYRSLV